MASQTVDILCGQCGTFMLRYQKKGSGQLIKLYLDRVVEPDSLSQLKSITNKSDLPTLACTNCGNRIGLPHEGGSYRMIKGSFRRKAVK
jgi:DNA-directed RNA polymerase subunit RPC12/RpoP